MSRLSGIWSSSRWYTFKLPVRQYRAFNNGSTRFQAAAGEQSSITSTRFDRFIARTPTKFLRTRLSSLKNAPISTITSFLILHEITAVVPLFALAGFFHYTKWLPPFFAEGEWVLKGVELFGRYFRRKGWITPEDAQIAKQAAEEGEAAAIEKRARSGHSAQDGHMSIETHSAGSARGTSTTDAMTKWWNRGEGGTRLVIEFATAYAVVKVLLPFRVMISIWGAPWFARSTITPISKYFSKKGIRSQKSVKPVPDPSKSP